MIVIETSRLNLRHLTLEDAPFIHELVNQPDWIEFIGDKGVRTLDDARAYITNGPIEMYDRLGFGLYVVELKGGEPIGICGLLKRDYLDDPDIGFAFLARFCGQGYASEAAHAVIEYAGSHLGMRRVVAVTKSANHKSIRLLESLGLRLERELENPDSSPTLLFSPQH